MNADKHVIARRLLIDDIRRFMVGPHNSPDIIVAGKIVERKGKQHRYIDQAVHDFYHTGFLSPASTLVDVEEDDQDDQGSDVDNGQGESVMVLANAMQQSAVGVTGQVDDPGISLVLTVIWGTYTLDSLSPAPKENSNSEIASEDKGKNDLLDSGSNSELIWKRQDHQHELSFTPAEILDGQSISLLKQDGAEVLVRRKIHKEVSYLTFSIINRNRFAVPPNWEEDPRMYQVSLTASSPKDKPAFIKSPNSARRIDPDFWEQELIYHHAGQYAIGHGISAVWGDEADGRVNYIATEWIPEHEVRKASPAILEDDNILNLELLSDLSRKGEILSNLEVLVDKFAEWVVELERKLPTVLDGFLEEVVSKVKGAGEKNIAKCKIQRDRIRAGIEYLRVDESGYVYEAFQLANLAILKSMNKRRPGAPAKWYPFQLAFIVMAIPSLSDPEHDERDLLDLIWFPTGGGKTEAYLGLSAYCLFYRGLTAETSVEASGTAIITRYTLRTLTVQQFERTTQAIMACETVRRKHVRLRDHSPWSIGLLVGSAATPKWLAAKQPDDDSAENAIKGGGHNKLLPLKTCPWCEAPLTKNQLMLDTEKKYLRTGCSDSGCEFHQDILTRIVDEDIWEHPPSFVVATIDKFAQLAWEPTYSRLLGQDTEAQPPSMIIQDELHLITDSLGTIAALYEVAIDIIVQNNGSLPKIIGATATIRQAEEQVKKLFLRRTAIFPQSGLDSRNSFFYKEDSKSPGRMYIGIHAQGRSMKHTWPRIVGTLAQSALKIDDIEVRDQFWTLVSYFNSIRELAGALVIAEDDVPSFQNSLISVDGQEKRPLMQKIEMTSQRPYEEITETLDMLGDGLVDGADDREPVDLLFATNMISVGVDVDRLGVMLIVGQPKTTAEYIQASSRVGRPNYSAGLVITHYNWSRPRDRSYYERFVAYHQSFYRFVEAVSITPFSSQARDRALSGVVAAVARCMIPEFNGNEIVNPEKLAERVEELLSPVIEQIKVRIESIEPGELEDASQHLEDIVLDLRDFLETQPGEKKFWIRWRLSKEDKRNGHIMLQSDMNQNDDYESPWSIMLSMRDTDSPSLLTVKNLESKNEKITTSTA